MHPPKPNSVNPVTSRPIEQINIPMEPITTQPRAENDYFADQQAFRNNPVKLTSADLDETMRNQLEGLQASAAAMERQIPHLKRKLISSKTIEERNGILDVLEKNVAAKLILTETIDVLQNYTHQLENPNCSEITKKEACECIMVSFLAMTIASGFINVGLTYYYNNRANTTTYNRAQEDLTDQTLLRRAYDDFMNNGIMYKVMSTITGLVAGQLLLFAMRSFYEVPVKIGSAAYNSLRSLWNDYKPNILTGTRSQTAATRAAYERTKKDNPHNLYAISQLLDEYFNLELQPSQNYRNNFETRNLGHQVIDAYSNNAEAKDIGNIIMGYAKNLPLPTYSTGRRDNEVRHRRHPRGQHREHSSEHRKASSLYPKREEERARI